MRRFNDGPARTGSSDTHTGSDTPTRLTSPDQMTGSRRGEWTTQVANTSAQIDRDKTPGPPDSQQIQDIMRDLEQLQHQNTIRQLGHYPAESNSQQYQNIMRDLEQRRVQDIISQLGQQQARGRSPEVPNPQADSSTRKRHYTYSGEEGVSGSEEEPPGKTVSQQAGEPSGSRHQEASYSSFQQRKEGSDTQSNLEHVTAKDAPDSQEVDPHSVVLQASEALSKSTINNARYDAFYRY